ncbi:MAG: hypothetical protein R2860_13055 [Desulfobacterales bacterium]
MNLCTNAYHAMRETGGVLGVSLSQEEMIDGAVVNRVSLVPGSYLHLEVSDTGHGMDETCWTGSLNRILPPAQGRRHRNGAFRGAWHRQKPWRADHRNRSPGKGSTFHVYWPASIAGNRHAH